MSEAAGVWMKSSSSRALSSNKKIKRSVCWHLERGSAPRGVWVCSQGRLGGLPSLSTSQVFEKRTGGFILRLWIQGGDKWLSPLFIILCGNDRKTGVSTSLERNAFPKDEFRQLYLMGKRTHLSRHASFPGGFYTAKRKISLSAGRRLCQDEGR